MRLAEFVVLAIVLLLLAALILPTMRSSVPLPRIYHVANEFGSMSASLTLFKVNYGIHPPSGINLYESQLGWMSDARSGAIIRQLWPQFDFTLNRDINRDGDAQDTIELTGAECLVFFLGGIRREHGQNEKLPRDVTYFTFRGFSKNPRNPLSLDQGSLDGPFFEFYENRLVDVDRDGFYEYRSNLPATSTPYLYLSLYEGIGYREEDCQIYDPDDVRNLKRGYYKAKDFKVPYNSDSFQIICAGMDDRFGTGGMFDPEAFDDLFVGDREFEHDNITSFHTGTLGNPSEKKNWFGFNMRSVCLLCVAGFILLQIRSFRRSQSCLKSESGCCTFLSCTPRRRSRSMRMLIPMCRLIWSSHLTRSLGMILIIDTRSKGQTTCRLM